MANRHLSRSIVLQTLFEWDFRGQKEDIKEVLEKNIEEFAPGLEDTPFLEALTSQVVRKIKVIDEIIEKAAPDWPIDKISTVDRNILRIGLSELLFSDRDEVPPKVAINEAIELAKVFGGDKSSKFVNGVLGAVYKEIGEPGKDQVSKRKKEEIDISKLPVEKLGGSVVYSKKPARAGGDTEIYLALVHDIFGYWTLSKGHIAEDENEKEGTMRVIKEEIGIDIEIKDKLGDNEYTAKDPKKGPIRKHVFYFLALAPHDELKLPEEKGGLDDVRWFKFEEIPDLKIYDDILPIITKAIKIITK